MFGIWSELIQSNNSGDFFNHFVLLQGAHDQRLSIKNISIQTSRKQIVNAEVDPDVRHDWYFVNYIEAPIVVFMNLWVC